MFSDFQQVTVNWKTIVLGSYCEWEGNTWRVASLFEDPTDGSYWVQVLKADGNSRIIPVINFLQLYKINNKQHV